MTQPTTPHPTITFRPLRPALQSGEDQFLDVLVRVTPPARPETPTPRAPLNASLVLDRSGSMHGEKLDTAKRVALAVLDDLGPLDRFSVVTFDDAVHVLVPSTTAQNAAHARTLIRGIEVGGSTALFPAWVEGSTQVAAHLAPGVLSRVLLLSDGQANAGLTDPAAIRRHVARLAERGVSTSTFGMGDDYDEELLEGMANAGDGHAYYVERAQDLSALFAAELRGLAAQYGRTVSLGVEPNPGTGIRLHDTLNDFEQNALGRAQLPNLQYGDATDAVVRLHVPTPEQTTLLPVMRVRLAWTDPLTGRRSILRAQLDLPVLPQDAYAAISEDEEVAATVTRLLLARSKADAARAWKAGDHGAAAHAMTTASMLVASAPPSEYLQDDIAEFRVLEAHVEHGDEARARKIASSQAYSRRRSR